MTTGFGICPRCGTPLVAGKQFCGGCGLDVSAMAGSAPMAPPPWGAPVQPNVLYSEQPTAPQYPPSYSGAPYPGAPTSGAPYPGAPYPGAQYPGSPYPGAYGGPARARSSMPLILAGLGLVLVLVAGAAAFVVLSGNKGSVAAGPSSSAVSFSTQVATVQPTASPTQMPTIAEPTPTDTPVAVPTGKFGAPTMGRQVYDNGNLLASSQIKSLEASAASISSDFDCSVWMVTELADALEVATSAKVQNDLAEIIREWSSSLGGCYIITLIVADKPTTNIWWWSDSSSPKATSTFWSGLSPAVQPYLKKDDYYGVFNVIMTRFGQALAS